MAYSRTLALCLRVVDYSETSQIAAFFTREQGRLSAIAKGAKRKGSRFAGALEPLTLLEVVLFQGRDAAALRTLHEVDVRDTYRGARQSLRRLHAAAYVIEVLREAAPEGDPLPEVFDLAAATLAHLAAAPLGGPGSAPDRDPNIVLGFVSGLLELLGLFPRLDACVECQGPLAARAAFSAAKGGALCAACHGKAGRGAAREVSAGALQAITVLARSPERAAHLKIPPGQQAELRGLLDAYLAAALDKELRLAKYLV